jgi:hypothetical protein
VVKWLVRNTLPDGVPKGWNRLNELIKKEGFPPGRMCGRNRIWHDQEIDEWLLNRPTDKSFLRGRAKTLVEGARPPEIVKPGPSGATEGTGQTKQFN